MKPNKTQSISERVYAILLYLYPPNHRKEYKDLMIQLFRDMETDASMNFDRNRLILLWEQIIGDLLISLVQEYSRSAMHVLPFIIRANIVIGVCNLLTTAGLGLAIVSFISIMGGFTYIFNHSMNIVIVCFFLICMGINIFFAYIFLFNKHRKNNRYIYGSLLSIFSVVWMYLIYFGFQIGLSIYFPLAIILFVCIITYATRKTAKYFSALFSIVTLFLMTVSIITNAQQNYCSRVIADMDIQEILKTVKVTPEEKKEYGTEEISLSTRKSFQCKKNFNLGNALQDSYFGIK